MWQKKLAFPIVFLIFLVATFLAVDYLKDILEEYFPNVPHIVFVIIGFIIIITLLLIAGRKFGFKLPFWG